MRILGARSRVITFLAEAYLVLGRVAEAREHAEQAVALARAHQQRGWEAWGLKLLGDVHAHEPPDVEKGGAEQGGDAYRQALALATALGMRPLVAHCHFGLGTLYTKTGQPEEAREHFATATSGFDAQRAGLSTARSMRQLIAVSFAVPPAGSAWQAAAGHGRVVVCRRRSSLRRSIA